MAEATDCQKEPVCEPEKIEEVLKSVEQGDELTVEAEGVIDGESITYRDNQKAVFVDGSGIQFGKPEQPAARVIRHDPPRIYRLGESPERPLVDGLEITKVWEWGDE